MYKRTILIPSNRNLSAIKENFDSSLNYVESLENIDLLLTDNSCDEKKKQYFQQIKNEKFKYLESNFQGPSDNFYYGLQQAQSEYLLGLGDDDKILRLGDDYFDNVRTDFVGVRPSFVVYTKKRGVENFSNFSILEDTPIKRINEYFAKCAGNNNTLYSFFKKDIHLNIQKVLQNHPFRNTGYFDWAIVISFLAEGKVISDPSTVIFYDNERWSSTEIIHQSVLNLFKKNGLNPKLSNYLLLLLAFDSFILLSREDSALNINEKYSTALIVMNSYLKNFFSSLNLDNYDVKEINFINKIMSINDVNAKFKIFFELIDYLSPGKAEQYNNFFQLSTGNNIL